jgi:chromate reductase, NAD(P)H dehydrogenase (quinone)
VSELKEAITAANGLLLVTPEYNNSIPGVFKNAIDWLSRPPTDIQRVFGGKPVALIGASPGGFGTILSQNAWLPVPRTLGAELWPEGRLLVSRAQGVFDESGTLTDAEVQQRYLPSAIVSVAELVAGTLERSLKRRSPAACPGTDVGSGPNVP